MMTSLSDPATIADLKRRLAAVGSMDEPAAIVLAEAGIIQMFMHATLECAILLNATGEPLDAGQIARCLAAAERKALAQLKGTDA